MRVAEEKRVHWIGYFEKSLRKTYSMSSDSDGLKVLKLAVIQEEIKEIVHSC